jgi:hypothetical protein
MSNVKITAWPKVSSGMIVLILVSLLLDQFVKEEQLKFIEGMDNDFAWTEHRTDEKNNNINTERH